MKRYIILVEGKDDESFMTEILKQCYQTQIITGITVKECGGKDQVFNILKSIIYGSENPDGIIIILDADINDIQNKMKKLNNALKGYIEEILSKKVQEKGLMTELNNGMTLGVWLMPDNIHDGMIEDFCKTLADQNAIKAAEQYVEGCIEKNLYKAKLTHKSKSIIYSYLAIQEKPCNRIGLAILQKKFKLQGKLWDKFKAWLDSIIAPPNDS